jgi:hypothetical protein
MTTIVSTLLDFILDLLRDPEAAAEFEADPEGTLAAAGLGDVCSADLEELLPMLADYAPVAGGVGGWYPGDSDGDSGNGSDDDDEGGYTPGGQHGGEGGELDIVAKLKFIQQNFSYEETTITHIDASHAVWAGGDVTQLFGDDNVVATEGSLALGEDAELEVEGDLEWSVKDSFNPTIGSTVVEVDGDAENLVVGSEVTDSVLLQGEDFDIENLVNGDGNQTDVEAENAVLGNGNAVDNDLDLDVDVENSGNTIEGTGNAIGEDNDLDTENSGNDIDGDGNAVGEGAVAGNSETEVDVEIDDITVAENAVVDSENVVQTDDSTVEDSNLAGDDISDDDLDVDVDVEDVYVTEAENAVVDSENVIQDTEFEDDAVIVNDNELEVDLGLGGGAGGFEAEPAA